MVNQSVDIPFGRNPLEKLIHTGGGGTSVIMSRSPYRFRRGQSPLTTSREGIAKAFDGGKGGSTKKSFRWNRPVNMSMDQKTINRLIEARRCMEIPTKPEMDK